MSFFIKTIALAAVFCAASVFAEPVTVPHTFQPGTPARSAEVNENLQALATAIQGMKRLSLYQDGVRIGKSILLTAIKLDTNYVLVVKKENTSANIYLKNSSRTIFYASSDCTGGMYVDKTMSEDLISGEVGLLAGASGFAVSMQLPATATPNFFYNSVKVDGTCFDVSAYQAPTQQQCINNNWGGLQRVKETDLGGGSYQCDWLKYPWDGGPDVDEEILLAAYPVQLNNPAITGITFAACGVDAKGRPRLCVPNAELRSE